MSTQVKQIIFVGLAVVLIAFTVYMLRPQGGPAIPTDGGAGAPFTQSSNDGQPQVDPGVTQRIKTLQDQVQKDPKDIKALTELGGLYFDIQQFPLAADTYNRVLELDPKNNDVRMELGKAYFWQGMTSTAIQEFKKVEAADPTKPDPHYQIALALSHSNPPDVEGAVSEWRQVIKLAPDSDSAKKAQSFIDSYQKQK